MRSILVVRLYGIGNAVLVTPALSAPRGGCPASRITVLVTSRGAGDVVSGSGVVDSLIHLDTAHTLDADFLRRLRRAMTWR